MSITREEVIEFLSRSTPTEMLDIIEQAQPSDIDVNINGIVVWNSGINDDERDTESKAGACDDFCESPTWLNVDNSKHVQFYKDMINAGFEEDTIHHYRGRFYYDGPGIYVPHSEIQEVFRATKVRLTQDSMGLDVVLYPG